MQAVKDKCCGTCKYLESRPGKYDLPDTYCRLDGRSRYRRDMQDCIGWKERKEEKL